MSCPTDGMLSADPYTWFGTQLGERHRVIMEGECQPWHS